jgi:hypothetical protein
LVAKARVGSKLSVDAQGLSIQRLPVQRDSAFHLAPASAEKRKMRVKRLRRHDDRATSDAAPQGVEVPAMLV